MFQWLKSLFAGPQPAGPPQTIRSFSPSDPTIRQDSVTVEEDGWRIHIKAQDTFRLFEVENPGVEQCLVTYRAKMKSEGVQGKVYLEMWCRFPGRGEFFSKGLDNVVTGTTGWAAVETPFYLKKGQMPDLIKLNVAAEGTGIVWIKDVQLLQTPLKA